ncbi:MATE family efflux transporter [uncultured Eubacterium sp.]|uniref:MATE family efflux transporter n=1 Tax=uncultured Eubacterium sp. TaxID=165185 RepID=UPI0026716A7E|nr:MATE family efflux transporter [uncultured Eubacterium sp.]
MSRTKNREIDILNGSLIDKIILFALPLAASSILQQLFNSADVAVVGKFAGSEALAAVGANGAVINLLVNLFVGLSVGANVVISTFIGKGEEQNIKKAVHTSILIAILSGLLLMIIGITFAKTILTAMSTPENIIDLAVKYLRIYFSGMPFIMLYNFTASIFRSKGDTKRPLLALTVSGIVNVLLNLFFVVVLHMNVEGVAIATVISNIISSSILLYWLKKEKGAFRFEIKCLKISVNIVKSMAKIGVPAGVQGMVFSFSNVIIQSALNGLGSVAVAASAAALNYEYFAYFVLSSFSQAGVTFISQNYGAGNRERCRRVVKSCLVLGMVSTIVTCGIFIIFSRPLVGIFTSDTAVAELAIIRIKYILTFELINMTIEVLSGCMRGLGYSFVPACVCVLGICGFRILWIYTVFQRTLTFESLMMVYPSSWAITVIAIIISFIFVKKRVRI